MQKSEKSKNRPKNNQETYEVINETGTLRYVHAAGTKMVPTTTTSQHIP